MKRTIIRLLTLLGGMVAFAWWLGFDFLVERLVFYPVRGEVPAPGQMGLVGEEIRFVSSDGARLHGWWLPSGPEAGTLLYLHGNAGNISNCAEYLRGVGRLGVNCLAFDYRGYGRSEGRPSEKGFYLDAEAALREARQRSGHDRVAVVGHSLGGIAAVHLAAKFPVAGVILESTFTNLADMARAIYKLPSPRGWLDRKFNATEKIAQIELPILIFHAGRDEVVPLELGRRLAALAPRAEFILVEGAGHNDLSQVAGDKYFQAVARYLKTMGMAPGHHRSGSAP